jgi:hypothetical protein
LRGAVFGREVTSFWISLGKSSNIVVLGKVNERTSNPIEMQAETETK